MSASWSNSENAVAPPCVHCASVSAPWRVRQASGCCERYRGIGNPQSEFEFKYFIEGEVHARAGSEDGALWN